MSYSATISGGALERQPSTSRAAEPSSSCRVVPGHADDDSSDDDDFNEDIDNMSDDEHWEDDNTGPQTVSHSPLKSSQSLKK